MYYNSLNTMFCTFLPTGIILMMQITGRMQSQQNFQGYIMLVKPKLLIIYFIYLMKAEKLKTEIDEYIVLPLKWNIIF